MKYDWREQLRKGVAPEDLDVPDDDRPPLRMKKKPKPKRPDEGIRRHQPGTLPPVEES